MLVSYSKPIKRHALAGGTLCALLSMLLPTALAGNYGTPVGVAKSYHAGGQYSTDNPGVRLPATLPNRLLIPQTNEPLVEAGVASAEGYTPILIAGTPVVSAPYYGVQTEFQGGDLLVNAATINKDLALMLVSQNFYSALSKRGEPLPSHPVIELSGLVEAQVVKARDFAHNTTSDVNLTAAELDIYAGLNPWVSAFMQIEYDDGNDGRLRRVNNSRVKIGSAFINIGNLDASSFYLTLGQMFLPFGQYSSSLVSNSLPKALGRTKQRAGLLGFYTSEGTSSLNASVFAFRGDTDARGSSFSPNDDINGVGGNVSYHYDGPVIDVSLGASVINNLAESNGLQSLLAGSTLYQHIERQVPAINLRGSVKAYGNKLSAEYVGAVRRFDKHDDIAHNTHGARPEALHLEYAYSFDVMAHSATVAFGYDHSWDALAIGLPEQRFSTAFSFAPWRATVFSVEYRYDEDYDDDAIAGKRDSAGNLTHVFNTGTHHCAHSVTAQLDVFF